MIFFSIITKISEHAFVIITDINFYLITDYVYFCQLTAFTCIQSSLYIFNTNTFP